MNAYTGKILHIDLSNGSSRVSEYDETLARDYLGGTGFGVKMLIDHLKPGLDAFDPGNPLIYTAGAITGTMVPCTASKFGVFSKSPATGLLGEAYSTGQWGAELRMAGFDVLIITGKAKKPVYLWIDNGAVQLKDAALLWGKTTWEAEDMIRNELGDQNVRVSGIGQAGEKLNRLACIMNDRFRAAGRSGLGAVMGSKNLKAVAIRGTRDVSVAEPEELMELCKDLYERAKGPATAKYRGLGTVANMLSMNVQGALPTRNYDNASFDGIETVSGEYINEHYVTKIQACSGCPCRCEHLAKVPEGQFKNTASRIEYEPTMAFGPYCGVDDAEAIIKALEYCNLYGVDAIGSGIVVGFAMECFEKGLITKEDTGGLELNFGNGAAMVEFLKKFSLREDIGDVFAEGVMRASQKIGQGSEHFAMHIKGLEMTGYDARTLKTCALGYAVSRRGADHQRHGSYGHDLGGKVDRYKAEPGKGKLVMGDEDFYAVVDSMILCKFTRTIWKDNDEIAKVYSLVSGIPMTGGDLIKAGERINNLARLLNIREGLTRKDDTLPPRVMKDPVKYGVGAGSVTTQEDLDIMLDGYYEARGWSNAGVPGKAKLDDLGLGAYAAIAAE